MGAAENVSAKHKIVIGVDDHPRNVTLLRDVITSAGYTFFGATSGSECLSLVMRVEPRLILLDIQMPEMDGIETCRKLRTRPDGRLDRVPIAFITACNMQADVQRGLAAGGNDFILKPFAITRLIERVNYWTSRSVTPRQPGLDSALA